MRLVRRLSAPKITSGHGDIEKLVRKWCSTNHTASKPILSARTHCWIVSSITAWSSTTGRCISYARLNLMDPPPLIASWAASVSCRGHCGTGTTFAHDAVAGRACGRAILRPGQDHTLETS